MNESGWNSTTGKYSDYKTGFAVGEINLDWTDVDPDAIRANAKTASENAQENWAKNMKLPAIFSEPQGKFSAPDLTNAKLKSYILNSSHFSEATQIKKMWIGGEGIDWYVFKNHLSIPTHKVTRRAFRIVYKAKDGWCYFTDNITLSREYVNGKYENVQVSTGTSKTKIDCKNVK